MESLNTLYISDYVLPSDIPLIKDSFNKNGYGEVTFIELVEQHNCKYEEERDIYSAAVVHVKEWYDSPETTRFKEAILNNNEDATISNNEYGNSWIFEKANVDYFNQNDNMQNVKTEFDNTSCSLQNEVENLKNEVENLTNRLNTVDYYMYYNTNGIQYILDLDRRTIIKKNRLDKKMECRRKNLIAQRKWQNRLRSKNNM